MDDHYAEPVKVFVRIRPESEVVSIKPFRCVTQLDDKTIRLTPPDGSSQSRKTVAAVDDKIFPFDKVFSDTSTQEEVYSEVSSLVKATVRGYNTTIFAYGSTGSGKSFTMTGNNAMPGIIPRAITEIFSIIESTAAEEKDVFFYVRLSYVELYNNNFRNLLEFASKIQTQNQANNGPDSKDDINFEGAEGNEWSRQGRLDRIEVRENSTAGVFLAGPNLRLPVTSATEAFHLIAKGNKVRAVGSTQCNDVSSRFESPSWESHSPVIFSFLELFISPHI